MATALLLALSLAALAPTAHAVIPTGGVAFQLLSQKPQLAGLFCAPSRNSGWGVSLPESQNSRWKHIRLLSEQQAANADGCAPYTVASMKQQRRLESAADHTTHTTSTLSQTPRVNLTTLVVADRGNCSFLQKALLAQASGAKGLVIRGTRKAAYEAIVAARNGSSTNTTATISAAKERPPFDYDCTRGESFVASLADPVWSTDDPKCSKSKGGRCESKMCIPTGLVDAQKGGHQLCCLWDTYVLMGANRTEATNLSIPVVYMTIADGLQIARSLKSYPELLIRTYQREVPLIDVSSVLLWVIGVVTAISASYYSATTDRRNWLNRMNPNANERKQYECEQQQQDPDGDGDIWELDAKHAVGFILSAGVFLTVFYYVKIGGVIPILFCLSAAGTMTQLVMAPLLDALVPSVASRQITLPMLGDIVPLSEVLGLLLSAALAVVWYVNRRTCWYLQDVFGVSLCFVFLKTVQLPSLKVATILLSLAFVYDVFFVFISPLVFGSSVMEDVATGGPAAYTHSDYPGLDYCERYPTFPACVDPEPMPMLLVLPRILDWVGGVSMLGLGDIIIPGLLLSFALRFDYSPKSLGENYYRAMCIGYAVGLGMANIAVTLMQMGQPALMYLVPTTLGTLLVLSWKNGDLKAMWTGIGLQDSDKSSDGEADNSEEGRYNSVPITEAIGVGSQAVNDSVHDSAPLLGSSSP
ncbi:Signal peptide peptidase-like, aspartyl protease family a22b [Globisporangium polare]